MSCQIDIKGSDADGVMLISPTNPEFDSRVYSLLPEGAPVAFELKPCIVIVSNKSSRVVVAYSFTFWFTFRSGESHCNSVHFKYPDAVANTAADAPDYGTGIDSAVALRARLKGREICPGEQRVVGADFELWPDADVVTYRDSYLEMSESQKDLPALQSNSMRSSSMTGCFWDQITRDWLSSSQSTWRQSRMFTAVWLKGSMPAAYQMIFSLLSGKPLPDIPKIPTRARQRPERWVCSITLCAMSSSRSCVSSPSSFAAELSP